MSPASQSRCPASRRPCACVWPTGRCVARRRSCPWSPGCWSLPPARVTASEVLDLADSVPVRTRFGFDDDELAQIREWVAGAHIHWGLDAERRAAFKLTEVDAGTWAVGLQRLLLGVAIDADAGVAFGGVLPAAAIQSSEIELAGRFSEFVDRLDAALRALSGSAAAGRLGRRPDGGRRRPHRHTCARGLAAPPARCDPGRDRRRAGRGPGGRRPAGHGSRRPAGRQHRHHQRHQPLPRRAARAPRAPARGPADARELPQRASDVLHADADALGAPPGRLPARAR